MDFENAKKILRTPIEKSFSKTKFSRAELRRKSLLWALNLPKGETYDNRIESIYYTSYSGSEVKFGKPGKEAKRRRKINLWDMKPTLYEMIEGNLVLSDLGYEFSAIFPDVHNKINTDKKPGYILLALFYRSAVLLDHRYENDTLYYEPNIEIIKWLDHQFKGIGILPPNELIPMFDAILLNEDIKIYLNNERYQTKHVEPYKPQGRINTMGSLFAACAPEELLSRLDMAALFIRGNGVARIFTKDLGYGSEIISPMTGNIVYSIQNDLLKF